MKKRLVYLIGLFVLITIASAVYRQNQTKQSESIGGKFILTDQYGNKFDSGKFKTKLIFFGYTGCPDICPTILNTFSNIAKSSSANSPKLIFITIDPERDTIPHLKEYSKNYSKDIALLTGTENEIKDIANKYRIYFKLLKESSADKDYMVDHTTLVYLTNQDDEIIHVFQMSDTINMETINKYL